jgi:hypothetical protein
MAYARIVSALVADNAHADGYFDTLTGNGRFGIGRDWEAREPRAEEGGSTPDVAGQYGWNYSGQFEYLDRIGGIAPVGVATQVDMAKGDWNLSPDATKWRLSSRSPQLRTRYLHFYDGSLNAQGSAVSKAAHAPNLQFWIWRMGGAARNPQTPTLPLPDPPLLVIKLLGDGTSAGYAIALPAYREQGSYADGQTGTSGRQSLQPQLWGRAPGETVWTPLDNLSAGSAPTLGGAGNAVEFQTLRVEFVEDALLIRMSERGDAWAFSGEWDSAQGAHYDTVTLGTGLVQVDVIAHTAQFCMAPIVYPASTAIEPHKWFHARPIGMWQQAPQYRIIDSRPAGTTLTAAIATNPRAADETHPRVTFGASDTSKRAVLYCVQEYRNPVITAGTSNPGSTIANPNFVLMSCRGQINDSWRGSSMTAEVEAPNDTLNDLRPNTKIAALVNTTDGATNALYNYPTVGTPYYTRLFTGYATPPEKGRTGDDPFRVFGTLQAEGIIEARLRKHKLLWQCSFEGWPLIEAFHYLLHCAGVDDTLISVDDRIALLAVGDLPITIPFGAQKCARRFAFSPDTDTVSALDTLVGSCGIASIAYPGEKQGLQWGVNEQGVVCLAPCYEHLLGYYYKRGTARDGSASDGWTLTDVPADDAYMASDIKAHRCPADFANFLVVMTGQGVEAAVRYLVDEASWSVPPTPGDSTTARRFIADVWARFETFPDGADIDAVANEIKRQVRYWEWMVEWEMDDCPWILPDDEVRLQVTGIDVPTNSVYRVVNKSWSCGTDGRYSQTLLGHMVQEG